MTIEPQWKILQVLEKAHAAEAISEDYEVFVSWAILTR